MAILPKAARVRPRTLAAALLAVVTLFAQQANAQQPHDKLLDAIVALHTEIPASARSASTLGTSRAGSAIIIDANGLALTIGYLVLEASSATLKLGDGREVAASIVAYDHDTGFGLVRANEALNIAPMPLGSSAQVKVGTPAIVASFGGTDSAQPAFVVSRREFAGYWEYLLDDALFISPPYPAFSGAALIGADGKLMGVGSLQVSEAVSRGGRTLPGNLFVPIDVLHPIMGDLLASGHGADPQRPWLGLYAAAANGQVRVQRVADDSPAARAGVQAGDLVMGIGGEIVRDMASFYRALWATGDAGVSVTLQVLQTDGARELELRSISRYDWLQAIPPG